MGWENRGNGRYYYRKKRIGSKVVSEYVGTGLIGEIAEEFDKSESEERILRHKEEKKEIRCTAEINNIVKKIENEIKLLTKAFLILKGFHTHKGEWRKKRNERKEYQVI